MKSYRQKLAIWVEEKINNESDSKNIDLLNEIKTQIKLMEKEEELMINRTYESGYIDGLKNLSRDPNFYKTTYKGHDILKTLIK